MHKTLKTGTEPWNPYCSGVAKLWYPCLASLLPFIAKTTGNRSLGRVGLIGGAATRRILMLTSPCKEISRKLIRLTN